MARAPFRILSQREVAFGLLSPLGQVFFHFFVFGVDAVALIWQLVRGTDAVTGVHFAGVLIYLTIWNFITHTIFFLLSLVASALLWRDLRDASSSWAQLERVELGGPTSGSSGSRTSNFFTDEGSGLGRPGRVLSATTRALFEHRDRLHAVLLAVTSFVGIGYWTLLFPNSSTDQYNTAHVPIRSFLNLTEHGFTFLSLWVDTLLVRHRVSERWWPAPLITLVYGAAYVGWNMLCYEENGFWTYASVQEPLDKGLGVMIPAYVGLTLLFGALSLLGRFVVLAYWNCQDRRHWGASSLGDATGSTFRTASSSSSSSFSSSLLGSSGAGGGGSSLYGGAGSGSGRKGGVSSLWDTGGEDSMNLLGTR